MGHRRVFPGPSSKSHHQCYKHLMEGCTRLRQGAQYMYVQINDIYIYGTIVTYSMVIAQLQKLKHYEVVRMYALQAFGKQSFRFGKRFRQKVSLLCIHCAIQLLYSSAAYLLQHFTPQLIWRLRSCISAIDHPAVLYILHNKYIYIYVYYIQLSTLKLCRKTNSMYVLSAFPLHLYATWV